MALNSEVLDFFCSFLNQLFVMASKSNELLLLISKRKPSLRYDE